MTEETQAPATFRRVTVTDPDELPRAAEELGRAEAIGVDLEMAQRVHRKPGGIQEWRHVLALIQIAGGDLSVVVDPLRCRDLSALRPLMAGPVRKVFLGGGQDAALLESTGIPARNIVDVGEVALSLFGRREDGMAALAQRIYGISLDKTVRRTDWLARPINPVLLAYAHRDAELTLSIYYWFQEHYPDVVRYHERAELEPRPPRGTPRWILEVLNRPGQDPAAILMELGKNPAEDEQELADGVRIALRGATAPRQANRLLRLGGDLGLKSLVPDVATYVESPSSMLRGTAARVIGQLAEPETGVTLIQPLLEDPIEEVTRVAEAALREMQTPKVELEEPQEEEEAPSLGDSALAALQQLRAQMGEE